MPSPATIVPPPALRNLRHLDSPGTRALRGLLVLAGLARKRRHDAPEIDLAVAEVAYYAVELAHLPLEKKAQAARDFAKIRRACGGAPSAICPKLATVHDLAAFRASRAGR